MMSTSFEMSRSLLFLNYAEERKQHQKKKDERQQLHGQRHCKQHEVSRRTVRRSCDTENFPDTESSPAPTGSGAVAMGHNAIR